MQDIYRVLEELGIKYVKHEHPAVFTCEEAAPYYAKMRGGRCKNIFLRNRNGSVHYLVILETKKKLDMKVLAKNLGEAKIGFASPERLMKYLGLTPGSVTPLGLINDAEKNVRVIIDADLMKESFLNFHPNTNTATLEIAREDFKKFLNWCGNQVRVMDFST